MLLDSTGTDPGVRRRYYRWPYDPGMKRIIRHNAAGIRSQNLRLSKAHFVKPVPTEIM